MDNRHRGDLHLAGDTRSIEAGSLVRQNDRLKAALSRTVESYRSAMATFERFRQAVRMVQEMRVRGDISDGVRRLQALFGLARMVLILDDADFSDDPSDGLRTLPTDELACAASASLDLGRLLGPAGELPRSLALFAGPAASPDGSLFIRALHESFRQERLIGLVIMESNDRDRFSSEKRTDFLDHFCDILADTLADIAERRRAEQLREDVDRITRHDLKSPLNAILMGPQMLLGADNITPEQNEILQLVLDSGKRMREIINCSLSLFRMEMGIYELSPVLVDLLGVASAVGADLGGLALAKGSRVEIVHDGAEPVSGDRLLVLGEETLLYSMLANLVKNAIEAAPRCSLISIHLCRAPLPTISVHNPGAVAPEIRERFFEKYATFGKTGGTGLGTYSARLIARVHGGDAVMISSETEGTTVSVTLPGADLPAA